MATNQYQSAIDKANAELDKMFSKWEAIDKKILAVSKNARKTVSKDFNSGMPKDLNERLKKNAKSNQQVNAALKEQDRLEKALATAIAKKNAASSKTNINLQKQRVETNQLNKASKEEAILTSKLSGHYQKLSVELNKMRNTYKNLAAKKERGKKLTAQETKEYQRLGAQVRKTDSALKRIDKTVGQSQRSVGNYGNAVRGLAGGFRSLVGALGVTSGIYLFVRAISTSLGVIKDFEKQNATLAGVLQVEKSEMKALTDESRRLGESTVKTATEVAGLQVEFSRLGFTQQEIIDVTEATIEGSIAMNSELANTAKLTGAVINSMDEFSSTDAPEVLDILALSTAKSALDFEKLKVSLPKVLGAANALGVPFTKVTSLLGKLSDAGIEASIAGTSLRKIFISAAKEGIDYEVALDKVRNSTEKLKTANEVFDTRAAISAVLIAKNVGSIAELEEALNNAAGTTKRMAEKELDTLDGSLKLLRSAFEGYILDLNDASGAGESLKNGIASLAKNFKTIINVIVTTAKVWLLYKAAVILSSIQTNILTKSLNLSSRSLVISRLASIRAAQGLNVSSVATVRASLAWAKLNAAIKANAFAIVAVALYALYKIFQKLNVSLEETAQKTGEVTTEYLKNRDASQKLSKETNVLINRYDELKDKTILNKDEQKELNDIIQNLLKTVPDAKIEFDEYGKIIGINTEKIRENIKASNDLYAQRNRTALKENVNLLGELNLRQEELNGLVAGKNKADIESVGTITKLNGEYVTFIKNLSIFITDYGELSSKQIDKINEVIKANRDNINTTEKSIAALGGEKSERILAIEALEKQKKANEEETSAAAAGALALKTLRDELEGLKDILAVLTKKGYESLTAEQAKSVVETRKSIKAKQDEIDAILGVTKSQKENSKAVKNSIAYFGELISELEKARDTTALTKDEFNDFNDKIDVLKRNVSELSGEFDAFDKELEDTLNLLDDAKDISFADLFNEKDNNFPIFKFIDIDEMEIEEQAEFIIEKQKELDDKRLALKKDFYNNLENLAFSSINAIFQAEADKYDERIDKNNDFYDALLDNDRLSEDQRFALEKEKEKRNQQLEAKKREIEKKAFLFGQAIALAKIVIETTKAVMAIKAQVAIYNASLVTIPLAIAAAAQIPFVIGSGVAAAASILATTIPQFKEGHLSGTHEGMAIINDAPSNKYQELVERKNGRMEMFQNRNQPIFMNKGDKIHKATNTDDILRQAITMSIIDQQERLSQVQSAQINNFNIGEEVSKQIQKGFSGVKSPKPFTFDYSKFAKEMYLNQKSNNL